MHESMFDGLGPVLEGVFFLMVAGLIALCALMVGGAVGVVWLLWWAISQFI